MKRTNDKVTVIETIDGKARGRPLGSRNKPKVEPSTENTPFQWTPTREIMLKSIILNLNYF